jgi:hypothetical protein
MKMITKKQFRLLLTLSIVTLVLSTVAGVLDSWLLPQPLLDYQRSQHGLRPAASNLIISLLGIPGVIAGLVSVIGLYRFWPSAPQFGLAAWAYMLVWMCFTPGPALSNAVSASLDHCSTMLAGAVLSVAFFSPAADWFHNRGSSTSSVAVSGGSSPEGQ